VLLSRRPSQARLGGLSYHIRSVPWLWFTVPRKRLVKRHRLGQGLCYGVLTLFTIVPSVLNEYVTYTRANRRRRCRSPCAPITTAKHPHPASRVPGIAVKLPALLETLVTST
jgi:hypothetical protein